MMLDAKEVKTHETVWSGTLTPEQLEELLVKGLREALYTPHCGMALRSVRVEPPRCGKELPTIHYELVHDHEWYMRPADKPKPADEA